MEACPCSGDTEVERLDAVGAYSGVFVSRRHTVEEKAANVYECIDGERFDCFEELSIFEAKRFFAFEVIVVIMESSPHTPSFPYCMDAIGAGVEIDAVRYAFFFGSPFAQYRVDRIDAIIEQTERSCMFFKTPHASLFFEEFGDFFESGQIDAPCQR